MHDSVRKDAEWYHAPHRLPGVPTGVFGASRHILNPREIMYSRVVMPLLVCRGLAINGGCVAIGTSEFR